MSEVMWRRCESCGFSFPAESHETRCPGCVAAQERKDAVDDPDSEQRKLWELANRQAPKWWR